MSSHNSEDLARLLVLSDANFKNDLVKRRIAKNITVAMVAERTGYSEDWVNKFEHFDYDPNLSELRRYALAIGVTFKHSVTPYVEDKNVSN